MPIGPCSNRAEELQEYISEPSPDPEPQLRRLSLRAPRWPSLRTPRGRCQDLMGTSRMHDSHRKHLEVVAGVTSRELGSQLTQPEQS